MTPTYRLYYNDDGSPLHYSMEDLPGKYIEIDAMTFATGRHDIVVVNGKIKSLNSGIVARYHPVTEESDTTVACHPQDITILVDNNQPHKLWEHTISN